MVNKQGYSLAEKRTWKRGKRCTLSASDLSDNNNNVAETTVEFLKFVRLFLKVSRPGDSKGTFSVFESSCHMLLPV